MEPKKIDPKYFNLILAEIFDKTQIISLIAKLSVKEHFFHQYTINSKARTRI